MEPGVRLPRSVKPRCLRRGGAGHDRHLVEAVFAGKLRQQRHFHGFLGQLGDALGAGFAVHEQFQHRRIGGERSAVRVVGGEMHLPRVLDHQEQLQADGPLQGVVIARVAEVVGNDAAAIGVAVPDHPLLGRTQSAAVELAHDVGRDRHGLLEHHLTRRRWRCSCGRRALRRAGPRRTRNASCLPCHSRRTGDGRYGAAGPSAASMVAMRHLEIAGHAQIVGVQMHRMGDAQLGLRRCWNALKILRDDTP